MEDEPIKICGVCGFVFVGDYKSWDCDVEMKKVDKAEGLKAAKEFQEELQERLNYANQVVERLSK